MNVINVIQPYWHLDMWVFDDLRVGLASEPFVGGADTMIGRVTSDIPDAKRSFNMVFSAYPFPDYQFRLEWRRAEGAGNVYYSQDPRRRGLAPLRYFDAKPLEIYVQVRPKEAGTELV